MSKTRRITACRICQNDVLIPCIDLGNQYLSSIFPANLSYKKKTKKFPLELVFCKKTRNTCGTLQLAHQINLENMYKLYPFSSSTNSSMPMILKDVVDTAKALIQIKKDDLILDIGGNDGTLLSFFKEMKVDLLAIDPAKNIQQIFTSPFYKYINRFFSQKVYESVTKKKAKIIFSIAMFYHLSDPISFSREVSNCLSDDGVWVIQMAYLPSMIATNMYDNIVHEHVGYYTVHSMEWIMDRAGLEIFDVELNDVYGGSFRLFIKKKGNKNFTITNRLKRIKREEEKIGIHKVKTYRAFMKRVQKTREDLVSFIKKQHIQKKTIWIYGASTKGNTILQYCGLSFKDIIKAADANPFKFGKYIIGGDIPITTEENLRQEKPDFLLVLPYSFVNNFIKRESLLVKSGTKFIVPLPQFSLLPRVIGSKR